MKDAATSSIRACLPVIATVARFLCRELMLQNEYLRTEREGFSRQSFRNSGGTAILMSEFYRNHSALGKAGF